MGAWGYGSWQSDDAHDWGNKLEEAVIEAVDGGEGLELRAAAQLIIDWTDSRLVFAPDTLVKVIDALRELGDNQEWISSWDEPEEQRRVIQEQVESIEGLWDYHDSIEVTRRRMKAAS